MDIDKTNTECGITDIEHEQILHLERPTLRVLRCIQRPIYDDNNVAQGQVLYFRDITYETEVDAMKSEFLSTAAHELRTPLASIYGFSELLMTHQYDKEKSQEIIETIHRQSLNLKHLLDELLDLSRIEARAGKDFYMKKGTLEVVVKQCIEEMQGAHIDRKLKLDYQGTWPWLNIDDEKIHQVFNNVLSNAIKYSPGGEDVVLTIHTREKEGNKEFGVSIQDCGIGLTEKELDRIGERFYRADDSGAISGTGLGLALVNEILEIHHGSLEIASNKGVGSTFTVWLPII